MIAPRDPRLLQPEECRDGELFRIVSDTVRVLVSGEDTQGAFAVIQEDTPPGGGTPLHVHRREDEYFYVVQGQVEFRVAGSVLQAGPGCHVFAPRDIPHNFRNAGTTPLRMIVTVQPAGFEKFVAESHREVFAQPGPPDFAKFLQICAKYQIEILEPPPAA